MTPDKKIPVLAVVGPTCTGKTSLAIKICKTFGGEVIACDSRTVYKYFDIGTAKPTHEEQAGIRHHLLDVAEPEEEFTAARFRQLGQSAIAQMIREGKVPVVCGGTGFYSRSLLQGLAIPAVPPNAQLREQLNKEAESAGNKALHDKLAQLDPATAERLSVNDRFRVIRALEVSLGAGKPFSEAAAKVDPPYDTLWIGLTVGDRSVHRQLIRARLHEQLAQGLFEETNRLYRIYGANQRLLHTVNYRDLVAHIEGKLSWQEAVIRCEQHNYQLARKQMIWFKANPATHWFAVDQISPDDLEKGVFELVARFLAEPQYEEIRR